MDSMANPLPMLSISGTTLNFPAFPCKVNINFIPYALYNVLVSVPFTSL